MIKSKRKMLRIAWYVEKVEHLQIPKEAQFESHHDLPIQIDKLCWFKKFHLCLHVFALFAKLSPSSGLSWAKLALSLLDPAPNPPTLAKETTCRCVLLLKNNKNYPLPGGPWFYWGFESSYMHEFWNTTTTLLGYMTEEKTCNLL